MKHLALLLAVILQLPLLADNTGLPPLIYSGDDQLGPIGKHLSILTDTTGLMTIQEVMAGDGFQPNRSDVPNIGLTRSALWVKAKLINTSTDQVPVLHFDFAEVDELDLFMDRNGELIHLASTGDLRPASIKGRNSPDYSYKLPIPYGGTADLYLRLWSKKQLQIPLFVESEWGSSGKKLRRNLFMGGYMAIMLVMALYNLFIFLSTNERYYWWYILYIVAVCFTQLSITGYGGYYLWPNNLFLAKYGSATLTVVTMVFAVEFMQRFINTNLYLRHFRKVKTGIYAVAILGVLLGYAGLAIEGYQVIQATSAIMAFYVLYVALRITAAGHRPARYFLAAWVVFMLGILVFVAKDWGILPYNGLTTHMMTIGSALEVVLLSFGLADRINVLRREKEHSQAEALRLAQANAQIIRDQNVVLEEKVKERTQALQESNDHLKRTQSQLVNAEKMASLGQLTAGIAHEINNPLNFISSSIPPLKRDLADIQVVLNNYRETASGHAAFDGVRRMEEQMGMDETMQEVEEILAAMENGTQRTSEIVRGLRTFSRLDEDDLKSADINENIRSTVVVLGPQFRDGVKVHYDLGNIPAVECYPGKLNQLFMNLLNNAAYAAKKRHGASGGEVRIITRQEQDNAVVIISDNGIGIEESVQARLFEPFFTTKDVGEGTGLGLSIAKGIVDKHHGQISVESLVGHGTTFTITIPITQTSELAKSA